MLPASNKGVGQTIGFPDPCATPMGPAAPTMPYMNMGMNAMAAPFSPTVRLTMVPALNMASMIPMTTGDEPGVAHPTIKGPARFTMGNPVVYVNMLPGINLTCPTTGNNMNNALGAVLVPSVTNVFFTYRAPAREAGASERVLDEAALGRLAMHAPAEVVFRRLGGGVGYIALPLFSADLPTRAGRAMARLVREGARTVVLDLRGNPGGDADAFVRLAEELLPRGSVLCRRVDLDGDEVVYRARHEGALEPRLIVLVNRWTASAAELLAGCLQWHGRAVLIGERTYGKGAGRKVMASEAGFVEADAATFMLPGGEPLDGVGLVPDLCVEGDDGVLEAALAMAEAGSPGDRR